MKRILSILLSLIFVLTLVSCNNGNEQSEDLSNVESEIEEEFILSGEIAQKDAFMTAEIDRSLKAKNLFYNLSYTSSRAFDSEYVGGGKLTDGQTMDLVYGKNTFAGFRGLRPASIEFDLGEGEH